MFTLTRSATRNVAGGLAAFVAGRKVVDEFDRLRFHDVKNPILHVRGRPSSFASILGVSAAFSESSRPEAFVCPADLVEARLEKERKLLEYQEIVRHRMWVLDRRRARENLSEDDFAYQMTALKERVMVESQELLFGNATPHAWERYVRANGCIRPSEEALAAVAALKCDVVEIGAGIGHWAAALRRLGVHIVAFDDFSLVPGGTDKNINKSVVRRGSTSAIRNYPESECLLLVAPPPTSMALDAFVEFQKLDKAKHVVFVGEGRGGTHANEAFFDAMEKSKFALVRRFDVESFGDANASAEHCWVFTKAE